MRLLIGAICDFARAPLNNGSPIGERCAPHLFPNYFPSAFNPSSTRRRIRSTAPACVRRVAGRSEGLKF
jgi:hypothetical protein